MKYLVNQLVQNAYKRIFLKIQTAKRDPENAFRAYWINTGSPKLIEKSFKDLKDFKSSNELIGSGYLKQKLNLFLNFSEIEINEDAFFSLMLFTGYLTKLKHDVYKIPNTEIKIYFYENLLPIWIEKEFGSRIDLKSLVNELIQNVDVKDVYKQVIQTHILKNLDLGSKSEADFQALLGGIAQLACLTQLNIKHMVHSELFTKQGKRIDCFFTPINGRSKIVILHEYKKQDSASNIEGLLEDGLWQVYVNQYLEKAVRLQRSHSHWQSIIVRVIAFYRDELTNKWSLEQIEIMHTFEQARSLLELFSESGLILKNQEILLGKRNNGRELFLKTNKKKSLKELLDAYSVESLEEQPEAKKPKIV